MRNNLNMNILDKKASWVRFAEMRKKRGINAGKQRREGGF
jgi:hypothetical protein